MNEERRRILSMLKEGKITLEEAEALLSALEAPAESPTAGPKGRLVKVSMKSDDGDRVELNLPLALARLVLEFLPRGLLAEIEGKGIDLEALLAGLKGELPQGRLVEVEDKDGDQVVIEVV